MKPPMDGKWAGGTRLQFSGQLALTLPFAKGTEENGWLGRQALGQANHGGSFVAPWVDGRSGRTAA